MTNLDSIFKSRDITFLTKVHPVKPMAFPRAMYGYENWTITKAEHQRIDAFDLWYWRRLLRIPWTARKSNQPTLKEEKTMTPNSSTLAWEIPWMEEPGGLPSMGSHRVRHDWWDLAAAATLKEINPEYSLEGLMLKQKLQYFGYLIWRASPLEKTLMLGKIEDMKWRDDRE